jgi:hypothetical protein
MCLQFGFVIFWQKDFGAKAAHKMLVKLTPALTWANQLFIQLSFNNEADMLESSSILIYSTSKKSVYSQNGRHNDIN